MVEFLMFFSLMLVFVKILLMIICDCIFVIFIVRNINSKEVRNWFIGLKIFSWSFYENCFGRRFFFEFCIVLKGCIRLSLKGLVRVNES